MKTSTSKVYDLHRITWVDHARGIAILLVVYRHVVVGMMRAGIEVNEYIYNGQEIFYNFRMPIFFILSGVFIYLGLIKRPSMVILKERIATILYPYLFWAIILVSLEIVFSDFTNAKRGWQDYLHILTQPRAIDHLWYLFALFNTTLLFLTFRTVFKNKWAHFAFSFLLHCLTFMPFLQGQSLISDAFYFYPYFYLGSLLSDLLLNRIKSDLFLNSSRLYWLLPLFFMGQYFWFLHKEQEWKWFPIIFIINLIACYVVYIVANVISYNKLFNPLAYIGKYSLYIYILHVPLAAAVRNIFSNGILPGEPWVIFLCCWLVGIFVPIWAINKFNQFGILRLFSLKSGNKK